jgi:hypothetical protein
MPLQSSSSSLRVPTLVYCPNSQYPDHSFLQVACALTSQGTVFMGIGDAIPSEGGITFS